MSRPLRVGLPDSGIAPDLAKHVAAGRRFFLDAQGDVATGRVTDDGVGHGGTIARLMRDAAPDITLINAQIFEAQHPIAPLTVAAALDWLVDQKADLIAMSFGLRHDRAVLREACDRAAAAGAVMIAAAPARGAPVYPASYPDVLSVTGDARCGPSEISALHSAQAEFGACVRSTPDTAGASFAVGHACGLLAAGFRDHPDRLDTAAARRWLDAHAAYRGPERRTGPMP